MQVESAVLQKKLIISFKEIKNKTLPLMNALFDFLTYLSFFYPFLHKNSRHMAEILPIRQFLHEGKNRHENCFGILTLILSTQNMESLEIRYMSILQVVFWIVLLFDASLNSFSKLLLNFSGMRVIYM